MKIKTRLVALVTAAVILTGFSGCADTSVAMTIGGKQIPAGEFIFAQTSALSEAKEKFTEEYPDANPAEETFDYFQYTLEGIPYKDWVNQQATKSLSLSIAYENKFEELGLSLDEGVESNVNQLFKDSWYAQDENLINSGYKEKSWGEYYEKRGIGVTSYINTYLRTLKSEKVFHAYYDEDGLEPIPTSEISDRFAEENARVRMLKIDKIDVNGGELPDTEYAALVERAKGYVNDLNSGKDFLEINDEYEQFLESERRRLNPEDYEDEVDAQILGEAETESEELPGNETDETVESANTEEAELDVTAEADTESAESEGEETQEEDTSIFDDIDVMISKEDTSYGEELIEKLFALENNKADMTETDEAIYVFQRLDITERTDWLEDNKESIMHILKDDELDEKMQKEAELLQIQYNESAIKRYNPKKLEE